MNHRAMATNYRHGVILQQLPGIEPWPERNTFAHGKIKICNQQVIGSSPIAGFRWLDPGARRASLMSV